MKIRETVLAALVVSLALGADTASAAEPRIVGEWRFSGTGDERLKATVGRALAAREDGLYIQRGFALFLR